MNFIDVTIEKRGDDIWAVFGDQAIKVPEGKAQSLADYVGKDVTMGIRPEDIHDEPAFLSTATDATVEAFVEVTEMMGAEIYLYLTVNGQPVSARVNPRSTTKAGDTVKVGFDVNRIHFFDKETELVIK